MMLSTATEKMVAVDGLRFHCWDEGDGPPVVLVHGIGGSLEYWRYTVPSLVDRHRVIAIDLPGCGLSERGRVLPTLAGTAELLRGLLDALGVARASLVGNSLGGLVVLETALQYPDRVNRLILSNSAGLGRDINIFWRLTSIRPIGQGLIDLNRLAAKHRWPNLFFHPQSEPDIVKRCQVWTSRSDLTDTIVSAAQMGLDLRGQKPEIVRIDRLGELRMPTLIAWGRDDWIIPVAHGERAHQLIPSSRLVVFDNCGHCPQLERPGEFNRVAREFLAEAD